MERCPERRTRLEAERWAKVLMTRADVRVWSTDVELMATLYNILLRRDQVNAVEACIRTCAKYKQDTLQDISDLTASGLVAHALSSGDVNSVRELLRRKNLDRTLQKTFLEMQIIQRKVRGSEAEKDGLIPKFVAMRLWSGCSSFSMWFMKSVYDPAVLMHFVC